MLAHLMNSDWRDNKVTQFSLDKDFSFLKAFALERKNRLKVVGKKRFCLY